MPSTPITIFDSGLGGLTVLRAPRERQPGENFFADADYFLTGFMEQGDK